MKKCNLSSVFYAIIVLVSISISGCTFEEGKGGTATIRGKVYVEDYNNSGVLVAEGYAQEWDVYINYGDNEVVGDETKTSENGSYEFRNLHVGDYTVYAFSKCDPCPNNKEVVLVTTRIEEKGEIVVLEDLLVKD